MEKIKDSLNALKTLLERKRMSIYNYESNEAQAFHAAVNILATEYLVKTDNREEYGRRINQLYALDDVALSVLFIYLDLNMHSKNLGEMITQGDYDTQREYLFDFLDGILEE